MAPIKREQSWIQALPTDLQRIIVAKVASSSPKDYSNTRLSYKDLNFNLEDKTIAKSLNLSHFVENPWKAKSYASIIVSCLDGENLDAHFVEGVLQFFDRGNTYLGLHHLQVASRGGHPEGSHLFGMLLMCFGEIEKGKEVVNKLADSKGIATVVRSWETIQKALSGFTLSMEAVYEESYVRMKPPLHCHPEELNTVCSKCFHFFWLSEFFEMIMGLNNVVGL